MISKIFKNFRYKLIAVFIAAIAWYIVQAKEILEVDHRIQVTLIVPDGYMIQGPTTLIKDATLTGPRVLLGDIKSEHPLEARVYLPKRQSGNLRILLSKQHILNLNEKVNVNIIDPYMQIFIDEKVTRTLSIKEHIKGVPADGYIIEKTTIKPSTVLVTGLKSQVRKLKHILTEPIDIDGLQQTQSIEAELFSEQIPKSNFSVEKVTVNLQVGEKKINKRFMSIPVEAEGSQYQSKHTPRDVSIVIQGTPGVLSFVKKSELRAFLDVRDLAPGKYEKKIKVQIPPDTVLIETFPDSASIEILPTPKIAQP